MSCPVCNEPLVTYQLEGVEVDHCLRCKGTWLDAGELEVIGEMAGAGRGELSRVIETARKGFGGERRCPRCQRRLARMSVDAGGPVELDRCPLGHGLWFDHGELLRVLGSCDRDEAARRGEPGAVAAFFSDLYRSELETE